MPGTQTSQEKNVIVPHYPISSIGDGPIEFDVKPSSMYTDMGDIRLYLRGKVVKAADGTNLPATVDKVAVSNMLLHALIARVDVWVGDTLVTPSNSHYGWKAAIETLLNFGVDAKKSHLAQIMYYKDNFVGSNKGLGKRKALVKASKEFELLGPLHVDLFFQSQYLISNVPLRIRITRSPPAFYMVNESGMACKVS